MADLSDVKNALASLVTQVVFPNGTSNPSINGSPVIIYPGWPQPTNLDNDLVAGKVNISIYAKPEERKTTRYPRKAQITVAAEPTLTATIAGQTITIGGTVSSPQNVAVNVNGASFTYPVQPNDTLTSVATGLSVLMGGANSGNVVTMPPTARIQSARVGANATVGVELKRQEKVFMITIWANAPAIRDQLSGPIDVALAGTNFITMPDGYAARLLYKSTIETDALQKENLYTRSLDYCVEWATTISTPATQVTTAVTEISTLLTPIQTINS